MERLKLLWCIEDFSLKQLEKKTIYTKWREQAAKYIKNSSKKNKIPDLLNESFSPKPKLLPHPYQLWISLNPPQM